MKAEYLQRGEALDYTNATENTIPAGAVVTIATRLGVAGCDIPPGKTGSLHVCGVFKVKKTGTAAVAMGTTVYFDGTGLTDAADNGKTSTEKVEYTPAGYAAAPAAAGDETILVQLNG